MSAGVLALAAAALALATLCVAGPRIRRWAIRCATLPAGVREFAAATLSQGGVIKMVAYRSLRPLVERRLPRPAVAWLCRTVGRQQGIDFGEAERPVEDYATLDEFFVRGLRPGCRPICREAGAVVSPADATLVAHGIIEPGAQIVAKGAPYRLADLFATADASRFVGGHYLVLYLRPGDCHRVFCPLEGVTAIEAAAIPGGEMPVSADVAALVPTVFVHNRRLAHLLTTPAGGVGLVLIGAYNVGRIVATYDPAVRVDGHTAAVARWEFAPPRPLEAGAWLATFHLGSTVVLCFEPGRFAPGALRIDARLRYGERIGTARPPLPGGGAG